MHDGTAICYTVHRILTSSQGAETPEHRATLIETKAKTALWAFTFKLEGFSHGATKEDINKFISVSEKLQHQTKTQQDFSLDLQVLKQP